MRGVRGFAETVDDKVLGALYELDACVGDFAAVGEVCEGFFDWCAALADVPADYVQCAVFHGEREAEKFGAVRSGGIASFGWG